MGRQVQQEQSSEPACLGNVERVLFPWLQALMLPEAVRMLYLLKHALGKRVYVHCTAGINRATLTVVGYLTFVLGMALEEAEQLVKSKRSQAHPCASLPPPACPLVACKSRPPTIS